MIVIIILVQFIAVKKKPSFQTGVKLNRGSNIR